MHPSNKARLVLLSAKLNKKVTEFRSRDEESNTGRNIAIGAGAGLAAYGGYSLYKGRKNRVGPQVPGVRGIVNDTLAGNAMNVAQARSGFGKAGQAAVLGKRSAEDSVLRSLQPRGDVGSQTASPTAVLAQRTRNAARKAGKTVDQAIAGAKNVTNTVGRNVRRIRPGNLSRFPLVLR